MDSLKTDLTYLKMFNKFQNSTNYKYFVKSQIFSQKAKEFPNNIPKLKGIQNVLQKPKEFLRKCIHFYNFLEIRRNFRQFFEFHVYVDL